MDRLVDLKKTQRSARYELYIQPTFFKNEIDLICAWKCGNSRYEEERVMTCSSEKEAELELEKLRKELE